MYYYKNENFLLSQNFFIARKVYCFWDLWLIYSEVSRMEIFFHYYQSIFIKSKQKIMLFEKIITMYCALIIGYDHCGIARNNSRINTCIVFIILNNNNIIIITLRKYIICYDICWKAFYIYTPIKLSFIINTREVEILPKLLKKSLISHKIVSFIL